MSAETASIPSPPPRPRPSATDWWLLGPGVSFPAAPNGTRSTTAPAKSVWAAAALALGTPEGAALAAALLDEPDWRHTYDEHLTRLAELQSTASPDACVRSCRAGLDALHDTFEYIRGDDVATLREALSRPDDGPALATAVVRGAGPKPEPALVPVPFRDPNPADPTSTRHVFEGAGRGDARASLGQRRRGGTRRAPRPRRGPRQRRAMDRAADLEDIVFVLLGGTSELCPAKPLLARGASVAVVARGSARLRALAEYAAASPGGVLYLPLAPANDGNEDDNDDDDASPPVGSTLSDASASRAGAISSRRRPRFERGSRRSRPGNGS